MQLPDKLYKTTIVIWSQYDGGEVGLTDLAREADQGDAYCSLQESELVTDRADFPGTEFFGVDDSAPDDEAPAGTARPEDAIDTVFGAMGASAETLRRLHNPGGQEK